MPDLGDIDPADAEYHDYDGWENQFVRVADFGGYLLAIHKESQNWLLYFYVSEGEGEGRLVEQSFRVGLDDGSVIESYTGSDPENGVPPAVQTALRDLGILVRR